HTCARVGNDLFCWGHNGAGQLGLGSGNFDDTSVLTKVSLMSNAIAPYAAGDTTCALTGAGFACWGDGMDGQFGAGSQSLGASTEPIVVPISSASSLRVGIGGACALTGLALTCWGVNELLANGDDSRTRPMPVNLKCHQ